LRRLVEWPIARQENLAEASTATVSTTTTRQKIELIELCEDESSKRSSRSTNCGGSLKIIAIEDPPVIVKIHPSGPADPRPPRAQAQRFDLFQTV
jgi:hypothetical protein